MVQTAAVMSGSRHTPCSRGIIISLSPSPSHTNNCKAENHRQLPQHFDTNDPH